MSRNPQPFRPAFAVVRVDGPLDRAMTHEEIEGRITIKKIVDTQEEADAEVERLNLLLRDRAAERPVDGCFYFAQYTRVFADDADGSVRGD